ncbi:hypothetical protein WJX81_005404 [Elliptochloris bilobata]|uniref:Endonuclease/exonuclease/phosphatase domain-containing protein n=1 Tax=Elliptochloris bilobata TaxID=381761 RepID=A0AAW1SJB6_9CHLO
MEAEQPLRIFIWNINSLIPTVRNFVLKHGSLRGFFDHYEADIVCFQETKMLADKLTKELACVDGFESFWAVSRQKMGYSGVVTYVRERFSPLSAKADCLDGGESDLDREGRTVETDHSAFVLLNCYVPNAGGAREGRPRAEYKLRFLQALRARCEDLLAAGRQVIVVGDLNVAASQRDVHAKLSWEDMYGAEEKAGLAALLRALPDVWRLRHPDVSNAFTVWDEKTSARMVNEGVRIDYALVSPGLLSSVANCEIVDTHPKWSDHAALVLELRGVPPPPPHAPCALSSARDRRFNDRSQPSVAALFAVCRQAL